MSEKIIFVFPGQGAQYVGMGADLYRQYPVVRYVFDYISYTVGRNLANICFAGPAAVLNKPENTSLGTFAHSVAVARIIENEFKMPLYDIAHAMAGHSMGQYSALHCADSLSMEDSVKLMVARSLYMAMATPGSAGMAAIVGLNKQQVENLLFLAVGRGFAAISNYNSADQFIISGQNNALDAIVAAARDQGAKIAKRLNVSVPAHCALMGPAAIKLRDKLEKIHVAPPKVRLFSNQTACVMQRPSDIRSGLVAQMTNGVRWYEIMEKFHRHKITRAYELGPGRTLTRLIARTDSNCRVMNGDKITDVHALLNAIAADLGKKR